MPYFLGSDILIGWQHRLVSIVCVMRRFSWADLVHFNLLFHIWFSRPFDWISSLPRFSVFFSVLWFGVFLVPERVCGYLPVVTPSCQQEVLLERLLTRVLERDVTGYHHQDGCL